MVRTLWGEATDWLKQSRHQGRRASTRGLGSIVTPKAKVLWDVKCESSYFAKLKDIKDARMAVDGKSVEHSQREVENDELVKNLMLMFPKLEFKASYEVRVVKASDEDGSNNKKQDEGELRTMYRSVNLIEEAVRYLTSYFQLRKAEIFLRISKDTGRMVFLIAMAMANFLEDFKHRAGIGAHNLELEKYMAIAGLLKEGESTRNGLTHDNLLFLNSQQFDEINEEKPSETLSRSAGVIEEQEQESEDEFWGSGNEFIIEVAKVFVTQL